MTQQESRDSRHGHMTVETVENYDLIEEGWGYIRDDSYLLSFLRSQFLIESTVHRSLYLNCTCCYTLAVLEVPLCYIHCYSILILQKPSVRLPPY
jgi:hypothetical protein